MKAIKKRIRAWLEPAIERALGVKLYPSPPFGTDPYSQLRFLREWSSTDVVFDVGANDGRSVLKMQGYLPSPAIHAFEPVSSTFEILRSLTSHLENVHCYNVALGASAGEHKIYLHERASKNSFSRDWYEPHGSETVRVTTLDAIMDEQGLDFIHFLKIDTEGHELEVLRGARNALASSRIAIIQVEVGFDKTVSPHTLLADVATLLRAHGYYLHGIFGQSGTRRRVQHPAAWRGRPNDGYRPSLLKLGDAIFIKADLAPPGDIVEGSA
ncbi:hypothetical protein BH23GEM11_BH23GEM11_06700 [soil metagenome]